MAVSVGQQRAVIEERMVARAFGDTVRPPNRNGTAHTR
jgi:hypothetical protein